MSDPTVVGWVIFVVVISAVILVAILETVNKLRAQRRLAFRHVIRRLARVKERKGRFRLVIIGQRQ